MGSDANEGRSRRPAASRIWVVVALATAGCDGGSVRPSTGPLELGTWGGPLAAVIVSESLTHVHVGCTKGDVPARIELDDRGRFDVDGRYLLRAYPVAVGPYLPARFQGVVNGRRLTFSVTVNDTTTGQITELGPVEVRLGVAPQLAPCPICSAPDDAMHTVGSSRP